MNESNFLHNHPGKEKELGIDYDHVIVDREDWEQARKIIKTQIKRIGIIGGGFKGITCGIDEARTVTIAHEHIVRYPNLPELSQNPPFEDKISQDRYVAEILCGSKLVEPFKNLSMQIKSSTEAIKSLSEEMEIYDRENNMIEQQNKKRKGHERPYKYHR